MKKEPDQQEFSPSEYEAFFFLQWPGIHKEDRQAVATFMESVREPDVSDAVISLLLRELDEKARTANIAMLAFNVSEGRNTLEELREAIAAIGSSVEEEEEDAFVTTDLSSILNTTVKEPGLRWRLASLNTRLGSLRKGDFGFVFARPETGKTTFLADQCTYMAEQAKAKGLGPVLWFNNEEQGSKVMLRCFEAFAGKDLSTLMHEMESNNELFQDRIGEKLKIVDRASISKAFVERMCKKESPSLVVFDQIDKIEGFDGEREDLRMGKIYQWARNLAKTYCPVVGICQADGSGEGVKWLTMGNVANAKTAKQAEADWILGIGRVNEPGFDYMRYLHLSKNKLVGDEDTNPAARHDRWDVTIEPTIARYLDL